MVTFSVETDPRFQKDFSEDFVTLLDKHGFPVIPENPKDVHKLGKEVGEELNYYLQQSTKIYESGKLQLATSSDLDLIGRQFGLPRLPNENDGTYRGRLQAVFSPEKVTRPQIEKVVNQITPTNPILKLLEPWRQVFTYDVGNLDEAHEIYYDIGDSYYWSEDYWRSGVLVAQSGLSQSIVGALESLIASGIRLRFEQFHYSLATDPGINLTTKSYQDFKTWSQCNISDEFFYDSRGNFQYDGLTGFYDVGEISLAPVYMISTTHINSPILDSYISPLTLQYQDSDTYSIQSLQVFNGIGNWLAILFPDAISEFLSLTDTLATLATYVVQISENVLLNSYASIIYDNTVTESFSVTDSNSNSMIFVNGLNDTVTLSDIISFFVGETSVTLRNPEGHTLDSGKILLSAPSATLGGQPKLGNFSLF